MANKYNHRKNERLGYTGKNTRQWQDKELAMFREYQYQSTQSTDDPPKLLEDLIFWGSLILLGIMDGLMPAIGLLIIITIISPSPPANTLLITDDFMVLDQKVVFFANIQSITLHRYKCKFITRDGTELVISANQIVTRSRKEFKIKNKQLQKFQQIQGHLITSITYAQPQIQIKSLSAKAPA